MGLKIAVLIPDRGDRPLFMENCLRMIRGQTKQPDHVEIVNDVPNGPEKDITWRYRLGYDRLRGKGFDVIALMENDDWYAPEYLDWMVCKWVMEGKPELLGLRYTRYYHLGLCAWLQMNHHTRSSAMNTLIKADMCFDWCPDHEVYTDIHLWMHAGLRGVTVHPEQDICLGMKHGVGLCGGRNHTNWLERFKEKDPDMEWLRQTLDPESFEFYSAYSRLELRQVVEGV